MSPPVLVGLLLALVALATARRAGASTRTTPRGRDMYDTNSWATIVGPLAVAAGVPAPFALKWVERESGGNPCAVGNPHEFGDDGNPREVGLVQLYNPDDFKRLGVDAGAMRAYCTPGTQHCARALTPAEMLYQAHAAVALIADNRKTSQAALQGVGATWPTRDTWKLTKLVHALPGLVRGVATVATALGRAPADWGEYRAAIEGGVKLDARTEHYRHSGKLPGPFQDEFDLAEACGDAIPDDQVA